MQSVGNPVRFKSETNQNTIPGASDNTKDFCDHKKAKINCLNKPLSTIGELRSLYCSCGLEFIIKCCGLCKFGLLASSHPVGSNTAALTFLSCLPQPTYRDVNLTCVQCYSLFPWEEMKTTSVQFHCLIIN